MRLTRNQTEAVSKKTGARVFAKGSNSEKILRDNFGQHTFFRSDDGVFIVEPEPLRQNEGKKLVRRVKVARWSDPEKTLLSSLRSKSEPIRIDA